MATIAPGQSTTYPGKNYTMKNSGGVYSCSCPAWRNQSLGTVRTCKHLVDYLGDQNELARVGYDAMPNSWQKSHPRSAANQNASPSAAPAVSLVSNGSSGAKRPSTSKAALEDSDAPVLLAEKWTPEIDPSGYWMSEKLDGVRAYWDGSRFVSRHGNEFWAPPEFIEEMPKEVLDGELWMARKKFHETSGIVRTQSRDNYNDWKRLTFRVFDAPKHPGAFEDRLEYFTKLCQGVKHTSAVEHEVCENLKHLRDELTRIESLGGEGVMLRQAGSEYIVGRNSTCLKVKSFFDSECKIIGYTAGKGQHKGKVGAFECEQYFDDVVRVGGKSETVKQGTKFKIGSGLPHSMRANPPAVGTIITYRFVELTDDQIPRFATFVAVRDYE